MHGNSNLEPSTQERQRRLLPPAKPDKVRTLSLLRKAKLPNTPARVLAHLVVLSAGNPPARGGARDPWAWATQAKLACWLDLSLPTVKRAVRWLKDARLIAVGPMPKRGGGRGGSRYFVKVPALVAYALGDRTPAAYHPAFASPSGQRRAEEAAARRAIRKQPQLPGGLAVVAEGEPPPADGAEALAHIEEKLAAIGGLGR